MKRKFAALLVIVPILYAYFALFANALTDDAFITLRYVKTLMTTGTWGFLPGQVINAVTSPLNIFLLCLMGIFFGPTVQAVLWLSALVSAAIVYLLGEISSRLFKSEAIGYTAGVALIVNPLLISTLGLESLLFVGLYILCVYLYLNQHWSLLAATLGLLTLTRFDGVLFFLVTLLLLPDIRSAVKFSAIYLLPIAPWYLFSWIYFGSVMPDTLFIKTAQRSWGNWEFFNGMGVYLSAYRWQTIFSLLFLPFCLLLLKKEIRDSKAIQFLLLTSLAHYAGYSLLHVPPYYWYYTPEIAAIILIGCLALGQFVYQQNASRQRLRVAAVALVFLPVVGISQFVMSSNFAIKEMPIHTNWATHEQYKEIGEWLKENDNGGLILVDGEIGTLGYYCDCRLSSFFSDRRWLNRYVKERTAEPGIKGILYKLNFWFFDTEQEFPTPGYLLQQIPDGQATNTTYGMQWTTSTRWLRRTLIVLKDYSP